MTSGIKWLEEQSKEFDVFISYVQSDSSDYVDRLESALRNGDIVVWQNKSQSNL